MASVKTSLFSFSVPCFIEHDCQSATRKAVPKDWDLKETERCQMTFYTRQRKKAVVFPGEVTALLLPGVKWLSGNEKNFLLVPVPEVLLHN